MIRGYKLGKTLTSLDRNTDITIARLYKYKREENVERGKQQTEHFKEREKRIFSCSYSSQAVPPRSSEKDNEYDGERVKSLEVKKIKCW
jgi:hypothetical protein